MRSKWQQLQGFYMHSRFFVVHICTFLMLMRVMQEVAKKPNRARGEHPNAASMIAESLAGH